MADDPAWPTVVPNQGTDPQIGHAAWEMVRALNRIEGQFVEITGIAGPAGEDGIGIPPGGTTGQVLAKETDADFDTEWITVEFNPALTGDVTKDEGEEPTVLNTGYKRDAIVFVIDHNTSVMTTGVKGYMPVPWNCTIVRAALYADRTCSTVIDIWKCTHAQFDAGGTHPVNGDSITGAATPTLSSETKYENTTLSGWTTNLNRRDVLAYNVDSASLIRRITIVLDVVMSAEA